MKSFQCHVTIQMKANGCTPFNSTKRFLKYFYQMEILTKIVHFFLFFYMYMYNNTVEVIW